MKKKNCSKDIGFFCLLSNWKRMLILLDQNWLYLKLMGEVNGLVKRKTK